MSVSITDQPRISKEEFLEKYWKYYLLLEKDFMKVSQFVTLSPKNNKTFSIEFIKQYQAICSEIDTFFKFILNNKNAKVNNYKEFIKADKHYKKMIEDKVSVKIEKKFLLHPFKNKENWNWWVKYNAVKHFRTDDENYMYANLENVINSLSALFLLEIYYYNKHFSKGLITIPQPENYSVLFSSKVLPEPKLLLLGDEVLFWAEEK